MNTMHLIDTTGTTHAIGVEAARITLDGTACQINVKDTQVDLISSDPKRGVITVAPASLWHAFAGSDPAPEAAGLCLSEALARHTALQEIAELSQRWRLLLDEIDRHIQEHRTLPLPSYRFSRFVHQVLETLDGTEEQTLAVARILKQSPETIAAWGAQIGKSAPLADPGPLANQQDQATPASQEPTDESAVTIAPPTEAVTVYNARPLALAPSAETVTENQVRPAGDAKRGKRGFLWTEEHGRLLEEAVQASQQPSTNAKIKDISSRFGWPYHVVDYRMRQLQKKSQQEPSAPGEPASLEQSRAEVQPVTSPLTVEVSHSKARPSRSAEPASRCATQTEVQPVTSTLTVDRGRGKAQLSSGPFLWDVKINGYVQRGPLDAPYGNFPFASPGTPFVYRDEEYVLQQVWHSIIAVTPAVHAQRPAVMELAQA